MTSHPSRSYTLKTSSARPIPCVPSAAIVRTLCVANVISCPRARARLLALLCLRRRRFALPRRLCFRANNFLLLIPFFYFPPFPVPVLALYFGLATWVQPSHPAAPRSSSVSGANLVLTHRLLPSLPLSAAVRQFWCHHRWYERSDLWIQLALHRRCHRLCRYDHSTPGLLTVSSLTSTGWVHPGREAAGAGGQKKHIFKLFLSIISGTAA